MRLALALALAGCHTSSPVARGGAPTPEAAVRALLAADGASDLAAMKAAVLLPDRLDTLLACPPGQGARARLERLRAELPADPIGDTITVTSIRATPETVARGAAWRGCTAASAFEAAQLEVDEHSRAGGSAFDSLAVFDLVRLDGGWFLIDSE